MAVELEIRDGDPWYLSPDVWTVPGNDPEGPPGPPIAGGPCYLWAQVRNNGSTTVSDATVRYYWANPSTGFDRTTATIIGTSFVSLGPGEQSDVLCLTPWIPIIVNEGHECVLAEAFHSGWDPLPNSPAFNVPSDRHVAQRNLSVLMAAAGMFMMYFEIHNPSRKRRTFHMRAAQAELKTLRPLARHFDQHYPLPEEDGAIEEVGFVEAICPGEDDRKKARPAIEGLVLDPNERKGFSIVGRVKGPAGLVHVEQLEGDVVRGGLSVLILNRDEYRPKRK